MKYDDLLAMPYKARGREIDGMDCYGLVIECCRRNGQELKDITDTAHVPAGELLEYVKGLNAKPCEPETGCIVQCEYQNELHIGYLIDKRTMLHMTYNGARITPTIAIRGAKFYKVGK